MSKYKILLVLALGLILFFEALQTLQSNNFMESSKREIKELAENSIEAVLNGDASGLETYIDARKQEEYYKKIGEAVKDIAIEEREQYAEKRLSLKGTFIELSYSGDRLDYDDDPIHKELSKALKNRVKELKEAYKCEHTIVDCEGVIIPKVGVKTHGKQIIEISY